jgi:hypothetical protein
MEDKRMTKYKCLKCGKTFEWEEDDFYSDDMVEHFAEFHDFYSDDMVEHFAEFHQDIIMDFFDEDRMEGEREMNKPLFKPFAQWLAMATMFWMINYSKTDILLFISSCFLYIVACTSLVWGMTKE